MQTALRVDSNEQLENSAFWGKVSGSVQSAGKRVLEMALCLYFAAEAKSTPLWAKGIIYSALAYFILPTDAVPDFIPGVGYSDDLLTLFTAFTTVAMCITPEIKRQANEKLRTWFE